MAEDITRDSSGRKRCSSKFALSVGRHTQRWTCQAIIPRDHLPQKNWRRICEQYACLDLSHVAEIDEQKIVLQDASFCHDFEIEKRKIVLKDASFCHDFENGECFYGAVAPMTLLEPLQTIFSKEKVQKFFVYFSLAGS